MQLDPKDPAILALLVQRVEELTAEVKQLGDVKGQVRENTLKIKELEKDNSGHHRAVVDHAAFYNNVRGGMKVMFVVIGIAQAIFLVIGGAMFTAYVRGEVGRGVDDQKFLQLNQRIDDLRQEMENNQGKEKR